MSLNPLHSDEISNYMKEEFERMQQRLAPFVKKSMIYSMIAIPLIIFSSISLFIFLSLNVRGEQELPIVIVFAFLTAFGVALLIESFHKNREMVQAGVDYIIERISKSKTIPDDARNRYIRAIENDKRKAYQIFYHFLEYEQRFHDR